MFIYKILDIFIHNYNLFTFKYINYLLSNIKYLLFIWKNMLFVQKYQLFKIPFSNIYCFPATDFELTVDPKITI